MIVEQWRLYFEIAQFLLTGGIGIYVYLANKNKVTNDRINKLEEDIDVKVGTHSVRITRLETKAESSLRTGDLSELHEKINNVSGDVNKLAGEFSGVRNLLGTIHHHLLNGGDKR